MTLRGDGTFIWHYCSIETEPDFTLGCFPVPSRSIAIDRARETHKTWSSCKVFEAERAMLQFGPFDETASLMDKLYRRNEELFENRADLFPRCSPQAADELLARLNASFLSWVAKYDVVTPMRFATVRNLEEVSLR